MKSMESDFVETYEIESKLLVKPTKKQLMLKNILNIFLVVMVMITLFFIVMDGFSITKIGELCLAILVVSYFKAGTKPNYQFSILNLEIYSDKINFVYNAIKIGSYTGTVQYEVFANNIEKIEYSRQLNTIRVTGNISRLVDGKVEMVNELVVYCQGEAMSVTNSLERILNCKIDYLD